MSANSLYWEPSIRCRFFSHGGANGVGMLLVKTVLGKSKIHGLGVFAAESIRKGKRVWRFEEGFDRIYTRKEFSKLPKAARDFIRFHGYAVNGDVMLTVDHDRHMNHSRRANTKWYRGHIVARRNIPKGEEITNDYRLFDEALCAAFLKRRR
jgi:SET domain-containing protein